MSLDESAVPVPPGALSDGFMCCLLQVFFSSDRALQSHIRGKHQKVSDISGFVCKSLKCCVCSSPFSMRTRLIAHLTDKRCRGKRMFNCRDVVIKSGFIKPADKQEFIEAHEVDRRSRTQARKRGHTQPLSLLPAKRLKRGMTMSSASSECTVDIPTNVFDWRSLPPAKRLRGKTTIETVMSQWILQSSHYR